LSNPKLRLFKIDICTLDVCPYLDQQSYTLTLWTSRWSKFKW